MYELLPYVADVLAITVLVFAIYLPRHHRRDLTVAYLGVNIAVMAVSSVLFDTAVTAGVGLGLFGVLSIIRLRSDELAQHEIAYYFSALTLGLLAGLSVDPLASVALMGLIVGVLFVADHPVFTRRSRRQSVVLDKAIADDLALTYELERVLGGAVRGFTVKRLDLVSDTTTVEVRWQPALAPRSSDALSTHEQVQAR